MKNKLLLGLMLFFSSFTWAQLISTTATITDSDGQLWVNGSWSVSLSNPNGISNYNGIPVTTITQSGSLGTNGILSVMLYNTSTITPSGAVYNWTICSFTSAPCSTFQTPVTSANLTSLLNNLITTPRFAAGVGKYGYNDSEVAVTPIVGVGYFNTISNVNRVWNGTAWTVAAGGGTPAGSNGQVQINNLGSFGAVTSSVNNVGGSLVARPSDLTQPLFFGSQNNTSTNPNNIPSGTFSYTGGIYNTNCTSYLTVPYSGCNGLYLSNNYSGPGTYNGTSQTSAYPFTLLSGVNVYSNVYSRSLANVFGANMLAYGIGDKIGTGCYITGYFGWYRGSDEGYLCSENQIDQLFYIGGTITGGATTGSSLITASITHGPVYFNDGGPVLRTQGGPLYTATIASVATNSSVNTLYYNLTGITLTTSTAWGTIIPSTCGSSTAVNQQYNTITCTVTIGTAPVSPGYLSSSIDACLAGPFSERVQVTGVGPASGTTQTMTFITKNSWDNAGGNTNGAAVMQGDVCNKGLYFTDAGTLTTNPVGYMAIGAFTSTQLAFAACAGGPCNNAGVTTATILQPTQPSTTFGNANVNTVINFYQGAEVTGTNLGSVAQANLGRNSIPWTLGDSFIETEASEVTDLVVRSRAQINTPSICFTLQCDILSGLIRREMFVANDAGLFPHDTYFHAQNAFDAAHAAATLFFADGASRVAFTFGQIATQEQFSIRETFPTGMSSTQGYLFALFSGTYSGYRFLKMAADGSMGYGSTGGTGNSGSWFANNFIPTGSAPTVASATTVSLITNTLSISGTTAIATITPESGFTYGCKDVLSTGTWTTTTAGNIFATMTATNNGQYRFCFFGDGKWHIK